MEIIIRLSTLLVIFLSFSAFGQERTITINELPSTAQTIISKNFPNQAASYVEEDKGIMNTDYKVLLTGGTEIEFDGKGNWEEIDGNKKAIPNTVLPQKITSYVASNYKGQGVEKIEKESWGYQIELLSGLEIEFDNNGKFLRIDD